MGTVMQKAFTSFLQQFEKKKQFFHICKHKSKPKCMLRLPLCPPVVLEVLSIRKQNKSVTNRRHSRFAIDFSLFLIYLPTRKRFAYSIQASVLGQIGQKSRRLFEYECFTQFTLTKETQKRKECPALQ